jgi:hypothetical protein
MEQHSNDGREPRRDNLERMARKLDARCIDVHRHEAEIRRYFQNRLERMHIVRTTRTPHGQTIDWIPRESQLRRGERMADPPPSCHEAHALSAERPDRRVIFELEDPKVEHGPEGTVPVLRKNLEGIRFSQPLRKLLSKYPQAGRQVQSGGRMVPAPSVDGPHRYAFTDQHILCFGGEGVLSAFDPYCENPDDFSLMQIGLSNSDTGRLQTLESGWQERKDSYGDWVPHLFTYYTTNGYTDDDDNVGGYNQDVDGWVQYDGSVHPGAISSPNSTGGGDQYVMQIKYQLWRDNWWFMCNGRWLGYYPARLFMGNQSVFSTLGDHADRISFFGEIYDSNETPGKTKSDMGSGYWPEYGWQWAAYLRNLLVQTERGGGLADYDGGSWASDLDMYDLQTHMKSGTNWGSYFWLGGPGAG